MITHSGIHIQKIGGECGTPTTIDIAVHAGRICRFGGAVWYPLLPHLVFVGMMAYKRSGKFSNLLWGFLHDAHEIVTSDVPKPFKCDCMRVEQDAIDERLLAMFNLSRPQIDFDLIHECDVDACDIEAVELELAGYKAIAEAHAQGYGKYREAIHADTADRNLFRAIRNSPFYEDVVGGPHASGVWHFNAFLEDALAGDIDAAVERVKRWDVRFAHYIDGQATEIPANA